MLFPSANKSIAKLRQEIVIHRSVGASRRKVLFLSAKISIPMPRHVDDGYNEQMSPPPLDLQLFAIAGSTISPCYYCSERSL